MDLGAILLLLAVLLGVGFYLVAPLMRGATPRAQDEAPEVSALLAERDRIIAALQELDFDFKLGKVPVARQLSDVFPRPRIIVDAHEPDTARFRPLPGPHDLIVKVAFLPVGAGHALGGMGGQFVLCFRRGRIDVNQGVFPRDKRRPRRHDRTEFVECHSNPFVVHERQVIGVHLTG